MAIAAPSDEVIRLVEALGLRTKNTREVTLRMAVNEAVAVNTVEYVNGEQIGALAAELKERQYRLARWIPVEERWPKHGSDVLVAFKCGNYVRLGVGEFDGTTVNDDGMTIPYFKGIGGFEVTHWMPLPEPPV